MQPFEYISEKLAELQARTEEEEREREAEARQAEADKIKKDIVTSCNLFFASNLVDCQERKEHFTIEGKIEDGAYIRLIHYFDNDEGCWKTRIWAHHPFLSELPLITYSCNSVRESEEWLPLFVAVA